MLRSFLITGASGFLGSALTAELRSKGHKVKTLSRTSRGEDSYAWNVECGELDASAHADVDVVIHLAGESIADGRWSAAKKRRIRESRVNGTTLLAQRLAENHKKLKVFLSASAVGYYGDRGAEVLDESSAAGSGFLAEVCKEWESATRPAENAGIRTIHMRFGVILSPKGGALAMMLPAFRLGIAGRLGSGRQFMSWITLEDAMRAVEFLIESPVSGAVNMVAPVPVTNLEFTKSLGKALGRPSVIPVPALALRVLTGEMADQVLLASARVLPHALVKTGFEFSNCEIESALKHFLAKS